MDIFLERLKNLRLKMGLSQEDLSNYLNITIDEVKDIESGEKIIDTTTFDDICSLYGCDHNYLMGRSDNFSPSNIAFRCEDLDNIDLNAIASINKIRIDLQFLENLKQ